MGKRGERTNEFAAEIIERELSYDDVQALWHAASWHLVYEAENAKPSTVKDRMVEALRSMPEPTEEKHRAAEWLALKHPGIVIRDPDGWRSDATPLDALLTEPDFNARLALSMISGNFGEHA